jgi:phage tail-like protein
VTQPQPQVGVDTPPTASARAYLRGALPAAYVERPPAPDPHRRWRDFATRFVGALEAELDPVVALLDALPAHFSADLAPGDVLDLMAAWLGLEVDERWPEERRRELLRRAGELGQRRGTKRGLELALHIAFPDLPLRVDDTGSVRQAGSVDELEPAPPPSFVVYCDVPMPEEDIALVARMIEYAKPVGVTYKLRVRTRPAGGG